MKKYEKPIIVYENFQLAQNIAACGVEMHNSSMVEVCEIDHAIKGGQVDGLIEPGGFVAQNGECSYYISDYCYTNGSSFVVVHTS